MSGNYTNSAIVYGRVVNYSDLYISDKFGAYWGHTTSLSGLNMSEELIVLILLPELK